MSPRSAIIAECAALAACGAILVAVFGCAAAGRRIEGLVQLRNEGRDAVATIVATDCGKGASVRYVFDAAGSNVTATSGSFGFSCGSVRVGDTVPVKYLERDPRVNASGSLEVLIDGQLMWVYASLVAIVALLCAAATRCVFELKALPVRVR